MKYFVLSFLFGFVAMAFIIPQVFAESKTIDKENITPIFQTGIIKWSSRCYAPSEMATISVIDRDMNLDPKTIDEFGMDVWSDFDEREDYHGRIIQITVVETGNSTGVFEGIVFLGDARDDSLGNRVPVGSENKITAKYVDYNPSIKTDLGYLNVTAVTMAKRSAFTQWGDWGNSSVEFGAEYVYDPCLVEFMYEMGYDDPRFDLITIIYPSPLKQLESGLYIMEIQCKENLELIEKNNGSRYCVKPTTAAKLFERNWATRANLGGESSRLCYSDPDPGSCEASIEKYYFDWGTHSCKPFAWGGCGGNVPFDTLGHCTSLCS